MLHSSLATNTLWGEAQRLVIPLHDDVIKWKHFPRNWSFVRGIHRWTVKSPHKGQWRAALMFNLIGAPINGWVNNRHAGDLRRHRAHYDVMVMPQRTSNAKRACYVSNLWLSQFVTESVEICDNVKIFISTIYIQSIWINMFSSILLILIWDLFITPVFTWRQQH